MYRAKCTPYIFPKILMGLILVYRRFRLTDALKSMCFAILNHFLLTAEFLDKPNLEAISEVSQKVVILNERGAFF